jgi:hypothetical protein
MDLGLTLKRENNPPMYTTSLVPILPFFCLLSWNEKTNDSQDHEKGKQTSQVHKKSTPNLTVLLSIYIIF